MGRSLQGVKHYFFTGDGANSPDKAPNEPVPRAVKSSGVGLLLTCNAIAPIRQPNTVDVSPPTTK
jgi:hypothetical protein